MKRSGLIIASLTVVAVLVAIIGWRLVSDDADDRGAVDVPSRGDGAKMSAPALAIAAPVELAARAADLPAAQAAELAQATQELFDLYRDGSWKRFFELRRANGLELPAERREKRRQRAWENAVQPFRELDLIVTEATVELGDADAMVMRPPKPPPAGSEGRQRILSPTFDPFQEGETVRQRFAGQPHALVSVPIRGDRDPPLMFELLFARDPKSGRWVLLTISKEAPAGIPMMLPPT